MPPTPIKPINAPKAVDINTGTAKNFVSLGIDASTAKKIVDGRRYRSKRDLVTRQILTSEQYGKFKTMLVARRPEIGLSHVTRVWSIGEASNEEQVQEFARIYTAEVLPGLEQEPGFASARLMVEEDGRSRLTRRLRAVPLQPGIPAVRDAHAASAHWGFCREDFHSGGGRKRSALRFGLRPGHGFARKLIRMLRGIYLMAQPPLL